MWKFQIDNSGYVTRSTETRYLPPIVYSIKKDKINLSVLLTCIVTHRNTKFTRNNFEILKNSLKKFRDNRSFSIRISFYRREGPEVSRSTDVILDVGTRSTDSRPRICIQIIMMNHRCFFAIVPLSWARFLYLFMT